MCRKTGDPAAPPLLNPSLHHDGLFVMHGPRRNEVGCGRLLRCVLLHAAECAGGVPIPPLLVRPPLALLVARPPIALLVARVPDVVVGIPDAFVGVQPARGASACAAAVLVDISVELLDDRKDVGAWLRDAAGV